MSREKDIQILCEAVKDIVPTYVEDHNCGDYIECPFCEQYTDSKGSMKTIKHSQNCAYLIAKDLSSK